MAGDRFLYRRGGVFYFRRRVPKALVPVLKREHIVESLHTSDYREASRLALLKAADVQRQFDEVAGRKVASPASQVRTLDDLSFVETEEMADRWFREQMQSLLLSLLPNGMETEAASEDADEVEVEATIESLRETILQLEVSSDQSWNSVLGTTMAAICQANGLAVQAPHWGPVHSGIPSEVIADLQGPKYLNFRDLVRDRVLLLNRAHLSRLEGGSLPFGDEDMKRALVRPQRRAKRSITLGELIEEFQNDPGRHSMRLKTRLDYGLVFRAMQEVIGGDRRLRDISRDDCKAVHDLFLRLPPNATKERDFISLQRSAEKAEAEGRTSLNPVTVNSHLHKMSALFNYGVKEERIDRNPARGLAVDGFKHTEEDRLAFTNEQLDRIFASPVFSGCIDDGRNWARPGPNHPRGTKFWVPLIALFHGMRLNEICQLRVEDCQITDGVWVFALRSSDARQRIKTPSGRRIVPLHPFVERIGFQQFLADLKNLKADRLFPDLKRDRRGYYSDGFQKWFSRFLANCGVSNDRRSFHSFRHNWRDAMREASVPQERVRLLGGWKRTAVDEMYGSGLSVRTLRQEVEKVAYDVPSLKSLAARSQQQQANPT